MFLEITLKNHSPGSDLGYLLHKHPDRLNTKDLSWGEAHIFFPKVTETEATAILLLEVDSIKLLKGSKNSGNPTLSSYINDRPYVSSSLLSTAISKCYGTALSGRCKGKEELANSALDLTAKIVTVPSRGGESLLRDLFEPLGYSVKTQGFELNKNFPDWGNSSYFNVEISAKKRLGDLLSHLYRLIPVLDADKHYWVGDAEVDKLFKHGEGWIKDHPLRKLIFRRYLKKSGELTRAALKQLDKLEESEEDTEEKEVEPKQIEKEEPLKLHAERHIKVIEALKNADITEVVDLGCGEGKFLKKIAEEDQFTKIWGMDISIKSLEIAKRKLKLDYSDKEKRERIKLLHGSLMYQDDRLADFEAAVVIEVIEHMEPYQLHAFERVVFEFSNHKMICVTTPNSEYNVLFENLNQDKFRHNDHRFEWTRKEFQEWGDRIANQYNYKVEYQPLGPVDNTHGAPSQMAIFRREI